MACKKKYTNFISEIRTSGNKDRSNVLACPFAGGDRPSVPAREGLVLSRKNRQITWGYRGLLISTSDCTDTVNPKSFIFENQLQPEPLHFKVQSAVNSGANARFFIVV